MGAQDEDGHINLQYSIVTAQEISFCMFSYPTNQQTHLLAMATVDIRRELFWMPADFRPNKY